MRIVKAVFPGVLLLGLLVGCGSPVTAEDVSKTTVARISQHLRGAGEAAQVMDRVGGISSVLGSWGQVQDSFSGVPVGGTASACDGGRSCSASAVPASSSSVASPTQAQIDESTEQLVAFLRDRVFTKQNLESSDATTAVFRINGDDICTGGGGREQEACVNEVDKLELRIRATPVGSDGIDLAVLIGPARVVPVTFVLRVEALAVQVDLGGVKSALGFWADASGQSASLPRTMEGLVELRLQKNQELDYTLSSSILSAVAVEVVSTDGVTSIRSAEAVPLSALRLDAVNRRVGVDLDLATTEISLPYRQVVPNGAAGNQLGILLSGLSFSFTAEEGQQAALIAHIGLGDAQSRVTLDNQVLFSADLNELSNRHFDLEVTPGADGEPLFKVLPEFDLVTRFFLKPLLADRSHTVPSYYEDETYRVRLSGGDNPTFRPLKAAPGFPGGLQILSGVLQIETSATGVSPVTVNPGECLVGTGIVDGGHPILGRLAAKPCP